MNKKIIFILFIAFLSMKPSISSAAPVLGHDLPKKNKVEFGFQDHYVDGRELENNLGELSSLQHLLTLSYGVFDNFTIDLKGGFGNIQVDFADGTESDFTNYLGGGYGFRWLFWENDQFSSVFGFQHISIHPYSRRINDQKRKAVLDDWQFSLLTGLKHEYFRPYVGIMANRMDYIRWIDEDRKRIQSDLTDIIGGIVGLNFEINNRLRLNFEFQEFDGQAYAAQLQYSF